MKTPLITALLLVATASVTAYAQTNPAVPPTTPAATQWQSNATPAQVTNQVPSYAQPIHQKTREEVYQELIQAQKDGSLAIMNKTYEGS